MLQVREGGADCRGAPAECELRPRAGACSPAGGSLHSSALRSSTPMPHLAYFVLLRLRAAAQGDMGARGTGLSRRQLRTAGTERIVGSRRTRAVRRAEHVPWSDAPAKDKHSAADERCCVVAAPTGRRAGGHRPLPARVAHVQEPDVQHGFGAVGASVDDKLRSRTRVEARGADTCRGGRGFERRGVRLEGGVTGRVRLEGGVIGRRVGSRIAGWGHGAQRARVSEGHGHGCGYG